MDVSIIMVNYNTREMTAAAIDSVFEKTTGIEFELILVDNASTDGSREFFEKDSRIKYFYLSENLGFGQANNYGVKHGATGTYLFFLNTDTLLIEDSIRFLFEFIRSNENIGVVGCNLVNQNGEPTYSFCRLFPGMLSDLILLSNGLIGTVLLGKNKFFNYTEKPLKVASISGAALLIAKQVFNEINGFSPIFFMYYEETDLCKQVRKLGKLIFNTSLTKIIHLEGGSQKCTDLEAGLRREKLSAKSRALFISKNHSSMYRLCDKILYCLYLTLCGFKYHNKKYFRTLKDEFCSSLRLFHKSYE